MGIPIGWNITREDAKQKDVLRADVTGQRSPIRRRLLRTRSPTSQSALDTDSLAPASRLLPRTEHAPRSPHSRTRFAPPPVPEVSRSAYRSHPWREPPSLQREDASFRRWQQRNDNHARAIESRATTDSERPLPALTPGFAPAAAPREADETPDIINEFVGRIDERDVPLVRHEIDRFLRARARSTRSRSPWTEPPAPRGEEDEDEHASSDNVAVSFPPLRRMGRRNIADGPLPSSSLRESWSPVSTVDGLGDRERSFSPSGESSQWETFYGTIVPDAVAPTAESSFASAAASASFSNSHPSSRASSSNISASSSHTHLTVPSRRPSPPNNEQFMRACDTSDEDTASDTEAEEDTWPLPEATRRRYSPITHHRRSRPSYFSDEPPRRDPDQYSRRLMVRTDALTSYVRNFYNADAPRRRSLRGVMSSPHRSPRMREQRMEQPDGPVDGLIPASDEEVPPLVPLNASTLDQELHEARSLLERLSRREDVGDDFWASVGLTRSFADRVESFNERERL